MKWVHVNCRISDTTIGVFSACDEFPRRLCLVGQVENLRAGWQPALFPPTVASVPRDVRLRLCCSVLQDLDFLARRDDFLVGQAVRLSPPAVAGVWLRLCCFVGQADSLPIVQPVAAQFGDPGKPRQNAPY